MRISELASRSGVRVPTIKFYLREHLLPPGRLTSPTQAQYDTGHLARIRLVRALLTSGLSVAQARDVLARLDAPPDGVLNLMATTQQLLTSGAEPTDTFAAEELLRRWGWRVDPAYDGPVRQLARALQLAEDAGFPLESDVLDAYAAAMRTLAEVEIASIPDDSPAEALRYVVLGGVLMEPVLLAIRRLAEGDAASKRYGAEPAPE